MRITEVNPEAIDLIEANILDDFSGQNSCGKGQQCTQNPYQGQYQSNNYQGNKATVVYMSCISNTACFSVNYASLSLQSGWNKEPKGLNWSCPSELVNRTPPSKSDTAPFWRIKPQPIRGFPTIEPMTF